ncbi:large ribosomal subunit protein mL66 [Linepithema humile]|uniref:large ribosomal subunit protein mL66 n=1 Tax=Linepithema humile TaxID=83485 RepID=UPI0006230F27|nr:PREDICTED: 28S ribosomal protein S18a, mitochondrial [Linepithema humile]XP_012221540.1 PREDICTED: 28S ribosomal protein S18a, mitochondrial [Linepithema humile]
MTTLCRFVKQFRKCSILSESNRSISLSATTRLKEIIEKKEGDTLIIEAIKVPQQKENLLINLKSNACSLCALGLDVKHTDVLILSQFVRSNGTMLPRRITGLCTVQQKRVSTLVTMAHKAGLMPNLAPKNDRYNPNRRYNWEKFNTYYDENTIRYKYKN